MLLTCQGPQCFKAMVEMPSLGEAERDAKPSFGLNADRVCRKCLWSEDCFLIETAPTKTG